MKKIFRVLLFLLYMCLSLIGGMLIKTTYDYIIDLNIKLEKCLDKYQKHNDI